MLSTKLDSPIRSFVKLFIRSFCLWMDASILHVALAYVCLFLLAVNVLSGILLVMWTSGFSVGLQTQAFRCGHLKFLLRLSSGDSVTYIRKLSFTYFIIIVFKNHNSLYINILYINTIQKLLKI